MTEQAQTRWHIVQIEGGQCQIVTESDLATLTSNTHQKTWGPFDSQGEAIARRVGLIRAGKCQPM